MSGETLSEAQQRRALAREATRLGASPLLVVMAACCFAANGYESALKCLREGKAKGIGES